MSRYRLTNRSRAELHDIFVYGYEQFGERQAESYAADLEHAFGFLADHPKLGRSAESIARGVRRHECGSHVILYEEAEDGVTILAVIHNRSVRHLSI